MAWYDNAWTKRKKITIDSTKVGTGPHADFPVLVNLESDTNLSASALASGNDILFTDTDQITKINYERVSYTSGTGALVAWVQIPSLISTANSDIYMYYGNSGAADQQNKTGTWNSNYVSVWHLDNSDFTDSTSNAQGLTNTSTTNTTGKIKDARSFNGTSAYLNTTGAIPFSTNSINMISISMWIKFNPYDITNALVLYELSTNYNTKNAFINYTDGTVAGDPIYTGNSDSISGYSLRNYTTTTTGLTDSAFHHCVFIHDRSQSGADGNEVNLYVDAALKTRDAAPNTNNTSGNFINDTLYIGSRAGTSLFQTILLEEMRINKTVLSGAWITTEYNNQNSPSTFYTLSAEESGGGGGGGGANFDPIMRGSGFWGPRFA